jgi:hypothetical protein
MQKIPLQVLNALPTHYTVFTADMIALCKIVIIIMDDFISSIWKIIKSSAPLVPFCPI